MPDRSAGQRASAGPPQGVDSWRLVDAAGMRALDRYTIHKLGVAAEVLMESAGRAVVEQVLRDGDPGPVGILCGPGNNGGDGFVVARHLAQLGHPVEVVFAGDSERLSPEASRNFARLRSLGIAVGSPTARLPRATTWVDALFGTGLARPLTGRIAALVRRTRAARCRGARVVAVDLPSGLDADTGQVLGEAVQADATVTLGLPKVGLALEPGRRLAGRVVVARIGIADHAPDAVPEAELWRPGRARRALPERAPAGHKGSFGHVLLVAGSPGKTGAAALAAAGAGRAGAGLVTVACPASLNAVLEVKCTEAMTVPIPDGDAGILGAAAVEAVLHLAAERTAVAAGPGLGRAPETAAFLEQLVRGVSAPLVLDADGLFPFADRLALLADRPGPTILTPHPGEAARLLGWSAEQINADRLGAARTLAERTRSTVILKGAGTVVAAPGATPVVNPTGGPELGSGGTGDVLTGVVGGLLAQGVAAESAAALASWVHGAAGDELAAARGVSGILAGDVAEALPEVFAALRAGAVFARFAAGASPLGLPFP